MRLLLCSDTHGRLKLMNQLAEEHKVDAILHAGDFGFYMDPWNLEERELQLLIKHSTSLRYDEKPSNLRDLSKQELVDFVEKHKLLSEFRELVHGEWKLSVPVYAIWGNHEDGDVIRALRAGEISAPNLHIVDENHQYSLGNSVYVAGLGGNFVHSTLFRLEPFMKGGKIHCCANQLTKLKYRWEHLDKKGFRIFLSHVSPARELLLEMYLSQMLPNLSVSGHMGPPIPVSYNYFALYDQKEVRAIWEEKLNKDDTYRSVLSKEGDFMKMLGITLKKRRLLPPLKLPYGLMKKGWSFNLPDAKQGGAIIEFNKQGKLIKTETWSFP